MLAALPRIEAGPVVVREPRRSDAARWAAGSHDPLLRHHSGIAPMTEADAAVLVERLARDRVEGTSVSAVIADPGDDRMLGTVVLYGISAFDRRASFGFWLLPEGRGRGLARAAAEAFVGFAVPELRLARLDAFSDVDNPRAHAVLEHVGFVNEGRLRSYGQRDDGSRVDAFVFGRVT